MKHTSGPWFALAYANYFSLQSVDEYSDTNDLLNEEKDPNAEANATLMAAAPDLLEALNKMLEHFWDGYSDPKKAMEKFARENPKSVTAIALAAIEKATVLNANKFIE